MQDAKKLRLYLYIVNKENDGRIKKKFMDT